MRSSAICAVGLGVAILLAFPATAARAQEIGDPGKGLAYARQVCASCHGIESGQRSSNPSAPSFETLAAIPGMSSTALYALLQTSHKTMPNIIIDADDHRNLIAYILALK